MTVAHTSIAAYHEIEDVRTSQEREIIWLMEAIAMPLTRRQISRVLRMDVSGVAARVNKLVADEALTELPETAVCPVTKKRVKWVAV